MKLQNKKKIPFLFILLCSFSGSLLVVFFSMGISGNDFWWHIKVGEWILNNGIIPVTDIFSWYAAPLNVNWVSHEWLSDVVFYQIFKYTNVVGIFILSLLIAAIIFAVFIAVSRKYIEKNFIFSFIYCLLFIAILYLYCYGRPQIFTYLLLEVELLILYRFKNNPQTRLIWLLPVLACLWANLHGGSSNLAYLLPCIFIVAGMFNIKFGKIQFKGYSKKQLFILALTTVLSVAFICLNPHGVEMLVYPYANMGDDLMLKIISEWHAPDAKQLSQLIFFYIPVFMASIGFVATKKKIDAVDFLLYGFFMYMFFRSTRFIVFFIIASGFFLFKYISPSKKRITYENTLAEKIALGVLFGMCGLLTVFGIYNSTVTYHSQRGLVKTVLSDEFVELVKQEEPQRLFSDYNFGETLIYNDIPVFVDSRADVYTGKILRDYVSLDTLTNLTEDYSDDTFVEDILAEYDFDAFLIEPTSSLFSYLCNHSNRYELVKQTKKAAYFRVIE